jgi:integrase
MAKVNLTDRKLQSLRPAPKGKRYDLMDSVATGMGIRVNDKGVRTFMLLTRYPGSSNPTRRALGEHPAVSLQEARDKAGEWRRLIKRGVDPGVQEAAQRRAEGCLRANTFDAMAADFIAEKLAGERCGDEAERDIRRELLPRWSGRPVPEITRTDIHNIIDAKKPKAPIAARNLLALIKRMFAWAIDQNRYGIETSPAAAIRPRTIISAKVKKAAQRRRVLTDIELFALQRAVRRMPYPYGPIYRLLLLTALRLNEVADGAWSEFDLGKRLWTIPATRMKGKEDLAREHVVPLTDGMLEIVEKLPRFKTGDYLFSTSLGRSPVWVNSGVKRRLDARILRTLRALSRLRSDDPARATLPAWRNHDIRRTVRSNLSALRVHAEVAEAILAHVRPGIVGVYDQHDYLDEKRDALERWAARLRDIMSPAPPNVVPLRTGSNNRG